MTCLNGPCVLKPEHNLLITMKFVTYTNFSELPPHYDSLFERQKHVSLYLTKYWFENLINTCFTPDDKYRIFAIEDDNSSQVLLMLVAREPASQNGSVYSKWNLKNGSLASLTNFQSGFYAPIVADLSQTDLVAACQCLAHGIATESKSYYFIDLNLMDPQSQLYQVLLDAFKTEGFLPHPYLYKANWYEDLNSPAFSDYLSGRSKSSQNALKNFQRKLRKFTKENNMSVKIMTGDDNLSEILNAYHAIYQMSWKENDFYPNFAEGLLVACARQKSLRFCLVSVENKPVAFEFVAVCGSKATMIRTAYIEAYKKLSVGSIAILTTVEHLINIDQVKSIDFGVDDDAYKKIWVQNRRERWGLTFIRPNGLAGYWVLMKLNLRKLDHRLRRIAKTIIGNKSSH